MHLKNKHILLGITGGIAAYKTAFLTRLLRRAEADVRVVMTQTAKQFIGATTFQGLIGRPVETEMFDLDHNDGMLHIELARWADLFCIAPASANTLAKMARGVADDLLTTTYLASKSPVAVVPAMNRAMWEHPATQQNCTTLKQHGVLIWGPAAGAQACGDQGEGRMLEAEEITAQINHLFGIRFLDGKKVIVTAGPTQEPWDVVRYLSNSSSGKMGFAMAQAAQALGAKVTLISGPVSLATPHAITRIDVTTAEQMQNAVTEQLPATDILISCAAVSDYRPAQPTTQKIKKEKKTFDLPLMRTPDILATIGQLKTRPFLVGFAAETDAVTAHAREKLLQKNLDMIIANQVGPDTRYGFGSNINHVTVLWRSGEQAFDAQPKTILARKLMHLITKHFYQHAGPLPKGKEKHAAETKSYSTKNS